VLFSHTLIHYSNGCANEILDARNYLECHANTEVNVTLQSTLGNEQNTIHATFTSTNVDRSSAPICYFVVETSFSEGCSSRPAWCASSQECCT
jgi:hypothetical protein